MCLSQWNRWIFAFAWGIVASAIVSPCAAEIRPDFLRDSNPELKVPEPVKQFSPALKSLWLAALDRPEGDMQRLAAETIARGHLYSVPGLTDAVPRLEALLIADGTHPATRFAAARALIVLESRDSSEKLFQSAQKHEADLRQLVEPALAKWKFAPAIAVWKERLNHPDVRSRDLVLALRGLAQVQDATVIPQLLTIVNDETRVADIRLEAATAAGQCAVSGLEQSASRLAHSKPRRQSVNSICACRILARHESAEARTLLTELTTHPEPLVAACALNRLLEIDSSLVLPLAEAAMKHADPQVRRAGAAAYLKHPTSQRVALAAQLMADPHPAVRREVCDSLFRISEQPETIEAIQTSVMELLTQDAWQGQEQAALLAGMLKYQPASGRLVELLESPRGEVGVASAWALRKVAVPATVPALVDKLHRQTDRRREVTDPFLDDQVAHLCEALGVLKADDATPLLVRYIPKNPLMGERSRCAAIWAVGLIKEQSHDVEIENALMDRVRDFSDVDPELDSIKEKSAISLGRMKAVDQATPLKQITQSFKLGARLGVAIRWALKELTGEELPPVEADKLPPGNWFLEPYTR